MGVRVFDTDGLGVGDLVQCNVDDGRTASGVYQLVSIDQTDGVGFAMTKPDIEADNKRRTKYGLLAARPLNDDWANHVSAPAMGHAERP